MTGAPRKRFRGSTTDSTHTAPIAPNIVERNFTADKPNQVWVGDITYLPTRSGWVYLAVLLDLFSRKVVGWELASHMRDDLCLGALRRAMATRSPPPGLVHHSDRGSQYASSAYRKALSDIGARQSMSRKGDCWDNACAESFFGRLEQELAGKANWSDEGEAREAVVEYVHKFYNQVRLHRKNGQLSPVDFEARHRLKPIELA